MAVHRRARARRLKTPPDPGVLHELRDVLRRAEFTVPSITGLLGNARITELQSRSPRLLHATRSGGRLATLVRLFVAGVPVPLKQATAALDPVPMAALAALGIVRCSADCVEPLISILPHDDLALASDQPFRNGSSAEYVPGITDSSVFLELFTVRRSFASALDIGVGSGVQSLRAALHTDHVVAVDTNRRALDFARFNAALNGVSNIELLHGSGFDAATDGQFDLIIGNLPFVVTPSSRYMYRDSGMRLDHFARGVIADAPAHLTEGGYCQLLCQWIEVEGQDWRDRLQTWFEGSGCDVWVLKNDSAPPDAYAEKWIRDTEPSSFEGIDRLFEQWMDFYETERITAIHSGAVAMRKRSGENWIRMDEGPDRARSAFGDAVVRAFALGDYLHRVDNAGLLDACLRVSPDIHLIQRCDWSGGEWRVEACQLRFHRELEYIANIDQYVSKLVARSTGDRTVRELISELAAQTGLAVERLTPACLELVRGLVERGFVVPVTLPGV